MTSCHPRLRHLTSPNCASAISLGFPQTRATVVQTAACPDPGGSCQTLSREGAGAGSGLQLEGEDVAKTVMDAFLSRGRALATGCHTGHTQGQQWGRSPRRNETNTRIATPPGGKSS